MDGSSLTAATSFLLSVTTRGEYAAPVAFYLALVIHTFVAAWRPLAPYRLNLLWIMGEFRAMHWDATQSLLQPPPLPWPRMSVMVLVIFVLFTAAVRVTYQQEF
jgi:hypothetical protein